MRLLLAIIIAAGVSGSAGYGFGKTAESYRICTAAPGNPWLCGLHGAAGRVRADPTGEEH